MPTGQGLPHPGAPVPHPRPAQRLPERARARRRDRPERLSAPRQGDRGPPRHHSDQDGAVDRAGDLRAERECGGEGRVRAYALPQVRADAGQSARGDRALQDAAAKEL